MLDLDKKVMRDSIYLVENNGLDGLFKKLKKKLKKVVKTSLKFANPLKVVSNVKAVAKFARKNYKVIGAAALTATAAYFTGGASLAVTSSLGGSSIASVAGKQLATGLIKKGISKQISKSQQKKMQKQMANMDGIQAMQDPEIIRLSQQIAEAEARKLSPNNKIGASALALEGNVEMTHQLSKISTPPVDILKVAIPIGVGLLAFML
jgi:hypothetical protein